MCPVICSIQNTLQDKLGYETIINGFNISLICISLLIFVLVPTTIIFQAKKLLNTKGLWMWKGLYIQTMICLKQSYVFWTVKICQFDVKQSVLMYWSSEQSKKCHLARRELAKVNLVKKCLHSFWESCIWVYRFDSYMWLLEMMHKTKIGKVCDEKEARGL